MKLNLKLGPFFDTMLILTIRLLFIFFLTYLVCHHGIQVSNFENLQKQRQTDPKVAYGTPLILSDTCQALSDICQKLRDTFQLLIYTYQLLTGSCYTKVICSALVVGICNEHVLFWRLY